MSSIHGCLFIFEHGVGEPCLSWAWHLGWHFKKGIFGVKTSIFYGIWTAPELGLMYFEISSASEALHQLKMIV